MTPNFILLYVKNPTASAAFYEKLLGHGPLEASPTFVMFALREGLMLGLWINEGVEPKATAPGGSEIAIAVGDRQAVLETHVTWESAGTPILQTPTAMDFGFTFVGADPDGHRIRVFAPGA
jgi:predicted enzyme related to lactoylglutathione lyase